MITIIQNKDRATFRVINDVAFDEVTVDIKRFKKALTNYNGDKITIYHEKSERSPFFFENHFNDSVELSLLAVMLKNY